MQSRQHRTSHTACGRVTFPAGRRANSSSCMEPSAHSNPVSAWRWPTPLSERLALSAQREELLEREQAARAAARTRRPTKDTSWRFCPINCARRSRILNWVQVLNTRRRRLGARPGLHERNADADPPHLRPPRRVANDLANCARPNRSTLPRSSARRQPRLHSFRTGRWRAGRFERAWAGRWLPIARDCSRSCGTC